ncbi:MAG: hypothetical protein ACLQGU_01580 [bacterium]
MKIGRFIGHIVVAFLISSVFSFRVEAATINAADCSSSAVQTAINSASNGDTVIIPNGSCTWTSGLTISKQITIQGANVPTRTHTATDGTTIYHNAGSSVLFAFTIGSSYTTTIANLRLLASTSTPGTFVTMSGTGNPPLMHDIYFDLPMGTDLVVDWDVVGGVIWNCTFESITSGGAGNCADGDTANDNIRHLPNSNWDSADTTGTLDTTGTANLYIENCIFINCPTYDCDSGCRLVFRHNNVQSPTTGGSHGPTSTTGGRYTEIYDNIFNIADADVDVQRYNWMRGGSGLFTGNSFQANTTSCHGARSTLQFIVESLTRTTSHGCCTSWQCFHQPGTGANGTVQSPSLLSPSQTPDDTYQMSDPVYIWGNSGTGNTVALLTSTNDDSPDECGNGLLSANFFVSGRDYFVSTDSSAAKPGWARYACPHPLTGLKGSCDPSTPGTAGYNAGSSVGAPSPPQNLSIQ